VATKYRDLYKTKVKGAVPVTEDEQSLFDLAMREQEQEDIADAVTEKLASRPRRRGGAPRKTGGDVELVAKVLKKHQGDTKLARQEFTKSVGDRDNIKKKRAGERFKAALKTIRAES
jgi:hypothetical protein